MATKTVKSPFLLSPVAVASGKAPGKTEAAKAERVTLRYKTGNTWQAVRVWNTAYYEEAELALLIKRHTKQLKEAGRKQVDVLRWTPTVFNAAGE